MIFSAWKSSIYRQVADQAHSRDNKKPVTLNPIFSHHLNQIHL